MKILYHVQIILTIFMLLIQQILSGCAMTTSRDIYNEDARLSDRYVFQDKCSKCHELPEIESYPYSSEDWANIIDSMLETKEAGQYISIEETVQNTISQLEEKLNRRDFMKYGVGLGKAVFIGGVLIGNFTGCTTASKQVKKTKAGKNITIKFAHITDTHVTFTGRNGTSLFEESFNIFRDIIDRINEMDDMDFILFGGDNINNTDPGTKGFDEFMNIMSSVKVPYFVQFGNRESSPFPLGVAFSKEQYAMKMKGHGLDIGRYWWSISPVPGLRILGLDTSIIDHDNGEIPQMELKRIKEEATSKAFHYNIDNTVCVCYNSCQNFKRRSHGKKNKEKPYIF